MPIARQRLMHSSPLSRWASLAAAVLLPVALFAAQPAAAETVTVSARANIYASGSADTSAFYLGGVLPVSVAIQPGTVAFQFPEVTAGLPVDGSPTGGATCIYNGAASSGDGNVCVNTRTEVRAANGFPAFVFEGKTMVLVGTFVGAVKGPTPDAPSYTEAAANAALTIAPALQQIFFIGDGRSTDGSLQTFLVPEGAETLYLGFADAIGFVGDPGWYDDNYGSVVATYTAMVPEPAAWGLMAAGLGVLGVTGRLRRPGRG